MILEESNLFKQEYLEPLLGDMYVIKSMHICSTDRGNPARRKRFWAVLCHRESVTKVWGSMTNVIPLFYRACEVSWEVFMIAEDEEQLKDEIENELRWAIARPKSGAAGMTVEEVMQHPHPWRLALNPCERRHREFYIANQEPGCCNMLNQNPERERGISSTPYVLHTILKNPGLHFSEKPRCQKGDRWFTMSEVLVSQGFPVVSRLGNVGGKPARCCSFCPGGKLTSSDRKRQIAQSQAGNSMNLSVSGIVTLYAIIFVQRADQARVVQWFRPL